MMGKPRGFGEHLLLELYGCSMMALTDLNVMQRFFDELPSLIGMTKLFPAYAFPYHGKEPLDWGVSAFVVLAESHASGHSFPDRNGFLTADVYSCNTVDKDAVLAFAHETFGFTDFDVQLLERGGKFVR